MWNLAKTCVIVVVCLALTGSVSAVDFSQPFVVVSAPGKALNLGEAWGPGLKKLGARMTAHVVANCPYHVEVSFFGLRHQRGKATIAPQHMSVVINGREVPVGSGRVPVASSSVPTPAGGVEVPIELQVGVRGLQYYPAGRYGGTLVITVMAGP